MDSFQKNILRFNQQLTRQNLECSKFKQLEHSNPDAIIIFGMGGSGLAGEILKAVQKEIGLRLPIIIWKDYGIPDHNFKNPLHIFASFSGNTEETISGLKLLLKSRKKSLIAGVTTCGELQRLCEKHDVAFVSFPAGDLTPRQATGTMFYSLIRIIEATGLHLTVPEYTAIKPSQFKSLGKTLSQKLKNRLIVIYTDQDHRPLGYIWKIKFNETAKTPAFNNVVPEMDHNEAAGFEIQRFKTAAIFLNDTSNPRMKKRFRLTEHLLKKRGVLIVRPPLSGKSQLEKTWRTIVLADWTSYFLAQVNRVDPKEIKIVEELRNLMSA